MFALINIVGTRAPFVCVACHAAHACTLQEFLLAQLHKIAILEYCIDDLQRLVPVMTMCMEILHGLTVLAMQ